jgi:tripeptidyl-peptidase-1
MVSLVNSARLDAGMPPLGFLNPALYKLAATPGVFNDITSGENNCCAALSDPICCPHGFTAQAGWDPVTGLGSINFPALKAGLMKMGLN